MRPRDSELRGRSAFRGLMTQTQTSFWLPWAFPPSPRACGHSRLAGAGGAAGIEQGLLLLPRRLRIADISLVSKRPRPRGQRAFPERSAQVLCPALAPGGASCSLRVGILGVLSLPHRFPYKYNTILLNPAGGFPDGFVFCRHTHSK